MKRILIAAAAVVGFAGAAAAQQAPQLYGNYSANVLNEYNYQMPNTRQYDSQYDVNSAAAMRSPLDILRPDRVFRQYRGERAILAPAPSYNQDDIHSGR
jgi:hypothetical protein